MVLEIPNTYKVIYIDRNFIEKRYTNSLADGDKFYTYGWGSICAREFKKYNPEIEVECWKADPRVRQIYEKTLEGVRYFVFPSLRFGRQGDYSRKLIRHLKAEIAEGRRLVINIASIRHLLFYTIALKLKYVPLVVQHHGEGSAIYKTKVCHGLKKCLYLFQIPLERMGFRNVDLFFALDERIKHYLPKGSKGFRFEINTTGVDQYVFQPINKFEAKQMLGWDVKKKHILYVGRLNYTKRPDILIEVYQDLKNEGRTDIELVLAGNENDDPLWVRAKNSGAILYPKISMPDLYKYLSAADVYVLPQYVRNHAFGGVGMLPIQAMLCETPVVGGNLISFPKDHLSEVGILAESKEAISKAVLEIISDGGRYAGMRRIAQEHYGWDSIARRTQAFYRELLLKYEN